MFKYIIAINLKVVFFLLTLISSNSFAQKKPDILKSLNDLPVAFTQNKGQYGENVEFLARGKGSHLFFTKDRTAFLLKKNNKNNKKGRKSISGLLKRDETASADDFFAFHVNFIGSNPGAEITGEERLSWNSNYFLGNDPSQWRTDVPNYSKIRLKNLYKGIDLVYHGSSGSLKYDLIVYPGSDVSQIALSYDIGESGLGNVLKTNADNDLIIKTPFDDIIEKRPYCYQRVNGRTIEVSAKFKIINKEENIFSFDVEDYDKNHLLVIDPEIVYSSFIGSSVFDFARDITVDVEGNVYITGVADGSDFPTTPGAFDRTFYSVKGTSMVCKLDSTGSSLVYSTYLGGDVEESGAGIAVDRHGRVYIAGHTESENFPVVEGAYDETFNGALDVFVCRLNSSGNGLLYSTYVGGIFSEKAKAIALDADGNVYVTGVTDGLDFPTTAGAYDRSIFGTGNEVFAFKLNQNGSSLVYSTYIGGYGVEEGNSIAVDPEGNAYVTGATTSEDFPTTEGAFDQNHNGSADIFVSKLNRAGSGLIYSTYLGGSDSEGAQSIAVDPDENIYILGYSKSSDFPTTLNVYDVSINAGYDIILSKINSSGNLLCYSTFIGGDGEDIGYGLAVDTLGNAYVTGYTNSPNFPATTDAFQTGKGNGLDAFISVLDSAGADISYSSFLGGDDLDIGFAVTGDIHGTVYIAGRAMSSNFYTSPDAFSRTFAGGEGDVFVTAFKFGVPFYGPPEKDTDDQNTSGEEKTFILYQNYPNPFNYETKIDFELSDPDHVKLQIYDITGQLIRTLTSGDFSEGIHTAVWDGTNDIGIEVSSGIYLYKATTSNRQQVKKLVYLK
ncbi:SBBP repeat-containing protein [candidate division KSB1 bacterium]